MSNIEDRLADYRALRDSSKKVLMDDIDHARGTFSKKGLTNRYFGGVIEGTKDVYDVAKIHASDHRGIIAIVLGILVLWLGREPLLAAMAEDIKAQDLEAEDCELESPEDGEIPPFASTSSDASINTDPVQVSETGEPADEAASGDTNDN